MSNGQLSGPLARPVGPGPTNLFDRAGLAELRRNADANADRALKAAAEKFETLFLDMMLKSMRAASEASGGGLLDSSQVKGFQGMLDSQLALTLGGRGSLGIADMVTRQVAGLRRTDTVQQAADNPRRLPGTAGGYPITARDRLHGPQPRSGGGAPGEQSVETRRAPGSLAPPPVDAAALRGGDPERFIGQIAPLVRRHAEARGLPVSAVVAQAALETGWGRHIPADGDGRSSNNLFGIKAGANWTGPRVQVTTLEYIGGIAQRQEAPFRAYASLEESVADYVSFISDNPRYRAAMGAAGKDQPYAAALQAAGYATDPAYASKIGRLVRQYGEAISVAQAGPSAINNEA